MGMYGDDVDELINMMSRVPSQARATSAKADFQYKGMRSSMAEGGVYVELHYITSGEPRHLVVAIPLGACMVLGDFQTVRGHTIYYSVALSGKSMVGVRFELENDEQIDAEYATLGAPSPVYLGQA